MDVLVVHTCTINLLVRNYLGDSLFTGNARNITVNVWKSGECIFAGFLEPNIYSQPWDHEWNSLSLNCTDAIATLQYYNYQNLVDEEAYAAYRTGATSVRILTVISDMLKSVPTLDLVSSLPTVVYYDGSVRTSHGAAATSIFDDVSLHELLFLGENFDEVWTLRDVLTEILKYFNLHMRQEGLNIYIYHLQSVRRRQAINWSPVLTGPGTFRISSDSYIMFEGVPHEKLIPTDDESRPAIPGNPLPETLSEEIVLTGGEWRRYYAWELPNGDRILNGSRYVVIDPADAMTYIHRNDSSAYKILIQNNLGDYDFANLEPAPASAYDASGNFDESYFIPKENEYYVTQE